MSLQEDEQQSERFEVGNILQEYHSSNKQKCKRKYYIENQKANIYCKCKQQQKSTSLLTLSTNQRLICSVDIKYSQPLVSCRKSQLPKLQNTINQSSFNIDDMDLELRSNTLDLKSVNLSNIDFSDDVDENSILNTSTISDTDQQKKQPQQVQHNHYMMKSGFNVHLNKLKKSESDNLYHRNQHNEDGIQPNSNNDECQTTAEQQQVKFNQKRFSLLLSINEMTGKLHLMQQSLENLDLDIEYLELQTNKYISEFNLWKQSNQRCFKQMKLKLQHVDNDQQYK